MAVFLRIANVFSPAIPSIYAANRLTVDRTVLAARTAVAALVTFGISITVSRLPSAGRYAPLLSAAASIGLTFAAYALESSRAKHAIPKRAVDLFFNEDAPEDVLDYAVKNPDVYIAIYNQLSTSSLNYGFYLYLKGLKSGNQIIIDYIEQNKIVEPADFISGIFQVPNAVKVSIDLETFQLICKGADPLKISWVDLWCFIRKLDDLSGHTLALFNKVLERWKSGKTTINKFLVEAIDLKLPGIVKSFLKNYSDKIEASKTTDYFSRAKDAKTTQVLLGHFKDFAPTPALLEAIISRAPETYDDPGFTQCDHLRAVPGLWAQGADAALKLCDSLKRPDLAAVIKADRFLYTPNKTKTDIEEMDRETFDAICKRCQDIDLRSDALDKTIHTNLWKLVCKFDYHSTEENSLFSKLMKLIDEFPHSSIVQEFLYAVKQNCPSVIEFLLKSKRIESTDYYMPSDRFSCWSGLQNARTAELLQQYGFNVNEHPGLLDNVIFDNTFYPRSSGFTRYEHVGAILEAKVEREFVKKVVEKLKAEKQLPAEQQMILFSLNTYLGLKK